MSIITNCPICGGTHIGHKCPFNSAPCVMCGDPTVWACSDCAIEGRGSVHVCARAECRDKHEVNCSATLKMGVQAPPHSEQGKE